ncbi:MAG: DUF6049 family protein [Acidimicrobiales bacterium]
MIRLWRVTAAVLLALLPLLAVGLYQPGAAAQGPATTTRGCGTASGSTVPSSTSSAGLVLVSQTSWVHPGGRFVLDLSPTRISGTSNGTLSVYIEVFAQLNNRSDFNETLCNQVPTPLIKTFGPVALSSLVADPSVSGALEVPITVTVPGEPAPVGASRRRAPAGDTLALAGCGSGCAGVYPVQVLLEPKNGTHVLSELTTSLVLTQPNPGSKPLALAWELPASAAPIMSPTGIPALSAGASAALGTLASSLAANSQVPLTLAPSPITLTALSASTAKADHRTLNELRAWAATPTHQVLATPYAPTSVSSLASADLGSELGHQLQGGSKIIDSTLHVKPDTKTWLSQPGGLSQPGLSLLAALPGHPISRLVLSDSELAPLPERSSPQITPIQPFALAGPSDTHLEAITADPGLSSHLVDGPDAVLAAHQLLADLAMIYFDAPNATYGRGVVLETPSTWHPNSALLTTALGALANSPIIQPVTLAQLFVQTPESVIEPYGGVLVRQLAAHPHPGPRLPTQAVRKARAELNAFVSTLGSNHPAVVSNVGDLLLASEATDLSPAQRSSDLKNLDKLVHYQFRTIRLQTDTVTLTARTAQLPVTITSDLAYPVSGVIQITSDKLDFASGGSTQHVTLSQRDKTVEFQVRIRATGRFPVQVSLVSPANGLVLATSRFAVRSSAFSPVAIGLTIAAGLVLIGWWGRTLIRGRRNRNRHLVPAGEAQGPQTPPGPKREDRNVRTET